MKKILERIYDVNKDKINYLKGKENKKIGYFSIDTPIEILIAANILPFRITGEFGDNLSYAVGILNRNLCPLALSCLSEGLSNNYDFINGVFFTDFCDARTRLCDAWRKYVSDENIYMLHKPKSDSNLSYEYYKEQLKIFINKIGSNYNCEITDKELKNAIKISNKTRFLLQKIYNLREEGSDLLTAKESIEIIKASMVMEKEEFNNILEELINSHEKTINKSPRKRVLICGSYFDNMKIIDAIEKVDARVVCEVNSNGVDSFEGLINESDNPLEDIAKYYFQRATKLNLIDTEKFVDRLKVYVKRYNVNSIILYSMMFCDNKLIDFSTVRKSMKELNIPVLLIEGERKQESIENMKTRIQAFLEM